MPRAMHRAMHRAMPTAMRKAMPQAMQRRGEERRGLRGEGGHLIWDTRLSNAREEMSP